MMTFFAIVGIISCIVLYFITGFLFCMFTLNEEHSFYEWIFNSIYEHYVKKDSKQFSYEIYNTRKVYFWSPEEEEYRKLIESHPSIKRLQLIADSLYLFVWPIFFICEVIYKYLHKDNIYNENK